MFKNKRSNWMRGVLHAESLMNDAGIDTVDLTKQVNEKYCEEWSNEFDLGMKDYLNQSR
jgi:hypothetical protein